MSFSHIASPGQATAISHRSGGPLKAWPAISRWQTFASIFGMLVLSWSLATPAEGQEAAAPPAAAPTAPAAEPGSSTSETPPPKTENYLTWSIRALGWTYVLAFLFISFNFVALVAMMILALRRDNICPQDLIEDFETNINQQQFQTAYDLARNDESFLGHVLSAGIAKATTEGFDEAMEAMHDVGEAEVMKLEHRLSYIALIGKISPMVGLLGTVHGMVMSFQVIATSNSTPEPQKLADGIATALATTLVGLLIAIPAVTIHDIFRNRIAQLVLEVGNRSEELMSRFRTKPDPSKK